MEADTQQNIAFNRIYRLDQLHTHHSSPYADDNLYIPPWNNDHMPVLRRLWLTTPVATPVLTFRDKVLSPEAVHQGTTRWLDYGVVSIPAGPNVLFGIKGLTPAEAEESHLVISVDLDLTLDDKDLAFAETCLLGACSADLGRTRITPSGVTTGDPVSFQLAYTTGNMVLPAGFSLRLSFPRCFAYPQVTEPDQPGYLTVSCPVGVLAAPTIDYCFESHERVDVIFELEQAIPAGTRIDFSYFTDKTYLVPSRWYQARMIHWFSPIPPMLVSINDGQDPYRWCYLTRESSHQVSFSEGPAAELHLFLPGRRTKEGPLKLKATVTDRHGNPVQRGPAFSDLSLWLVSDDERTELDLSRAVYPNPYSFSLELPALQPGVYRAEAYAYEDKRLISSSNPLEVVTEEERDRQIFWGGIHTHSDRSDGIGSIESLYQHARDAAHLEFAAAADHITRVSPNSWAQSVDITNAFHDSGEFATLIGCEFQDNCVYTSGNSLSAIDQQDQAPLKVLTDFYSGRSDIAIGPHGHTNHLGTFEPFDMELQRFVQVYGTFGGCDAWDSPFLTPLEHRHKKERLVATDYLDDGYRLGFTGGGDIHCARPGMSSHPAEPGTLMACDQYYSHLFQDGLTAMIASTLDRRELFDALRNRHTYATSGARILLDLTIDGHPMGSEVKASQAVCRLQVYGVDTIEKVDIIKNGKCVWQQRVEQLDIDLTWEDPDFCDAYYYARVYQCDRHMAWSSPIWVRPAE